MKNGQTGPRTVEGKAIAAQNARKHGILSECPVIPGVEQAEDWEAHRAAVYESFQPVGFLEATFVERVALSFWRLNRITRHERAVIAESLRECEDGTVHGKSEEEWLGLREHFQAWVRFLPDYPSLNEAAPLDPELVGGILATLCREQTEETMQRVRFLERRVPLAEVKQFPRWTVGLFRRALIELAGVLGTSVNVFLKAAEEHAAQQLHRAGEALALLEEQRRQAQARTHIPAPEEQARICRYEAHLSRELYKALSALEALQSRRTRRSEPLSPAQLRAEPAEAAPRPPALAGVPEEIPEVAPPVPASAAPAPASKPGSVGVRTLLRASADVLGDIPGEEPRLTPETVLPPVSTEPRPARGPVRNALQRVHALLTPAAPE